MKSSKEGYFRHITASVLQRYCELEDGAVGTLGFDVRVLNYRIDVQRALETLAACDIEILMAIHRDGITGADAVRLALVKAKRADRYVRLLEIRIGQTLERRGLMDVEVYLA